MWEKENKHIGLKILLVLLILVLLAVLFLGYRYVKAQEEAQDAELLKVYNEHQQEQSAAKQATYESLEALYQEDLDAIKTYLPGIVCWGDVVTAGSAGGVSYPDTLQELIDENIVDKYDFRGTLEQPDAYTRVEWKDYTVEIPVVNMGSGAENSATVLGRNGAIPFVVSEELVIPAEVEGVPIKITSENGEVVMPLTQGDVGVNNVTIAGVQGKLTLDLESYQSTHRNNYTFTRLTPGREVPVEVGEQVITAASDLYRDYIPVIFLGTYDGEYSTVEELISYQKAIINHQIANQDRYIVLGVYYMKNRWDYGLTADLEKFEAAMLQEYGNHFINVRKYLCSDGLSDAGINPTQQDTRDIAKGLVPTSLRSTAEPSELNAKGYRLLGQLVYDRMDKLGYLDEVKDELGITELEKLEKQGKTGK